MKILRLWCIYKNNIYQYAGSASILNKIDANNFFCLEKKL